MADVLPVPDPDRRDREDGEVPVSALTGRTRYRVGWFGRLVLQVEVDLSGSPWISRMDMGAYTKWRDARCADFNAMGDLFAKAPIPFPGQKPAHVRKPLPKTVPQAPPLPPSRMPTAMPASPAKDNE